jgi:hypothetical protein
MSILDKLPQAGWDELCRTADLLQLALARGWRFAGQELLENLDYALVRMTRELEVFRQGLPTILNRQTCSAPSDILADLNVLSEEFDEFTLDPQQAKISVRTPPIEMEDVSLGRFEIELAWEQIGRGRAYRVIAVDPNPPDGDDSVTHPHVRDQDLCEGEGAVPIKGALAQGRLLDFFTLVRQILESYNPNSAHVALDKWNGVNCHDCGWRMPSDEYGTCQRCEVALCGECSSSCEGCDQSSCSSCLSACASCDGSYCRDCLSRQPGSSRLLCESCLESQKEDESDESMDSTSADGPPADGEEIKASAAGQAAEADALCLCEADLSP